MTPDIETRLRTFAEEQGLVPEQVHAALLTRALEEAEAELQETMAGLDRSAEDFAAGRWITSEELDRQLEAIAAAARARRDGLQPEETKHVTKPKVGKTALAR